MAEKWLTKVQRNNIIRTGDVIFFRKFIRHRKMSSLLMFEEYSETFNIVTSNKMPLYFLEIVLRNYICRTKNTEQKRKSSFGCLI